MKGPFGIAIHGGAGTIAKSKMTKWKAEAYKQVLTRAYTVGFMILEKGGNAVDAVRESVVVLENAELFNAGRGSVLTHEGHIEMDAAIMEGKKLKAGAVAGIRRVKNPIVMAEAVMKYSRHVLISGKEALVFAHERNIPMKEDEYFQSEERIQQLQKVKAKDVVGLDHDGDENLKYGTVGAVALDKSGNLAAATSTGGMVNKRYGRIGDSPLIGIGTYANNQSCAISCTGHGEYFIRQVVAHEISSRIILAGRSLEEASHAVIIEDIPAVGGRGGCIGIDGHGNIVMPYNTKGMYRACKNSVGREEVGIFD